jgi:2,4-dienoyl-CoA reductase-like NADH-dependent reductase (Old Yellow Enzyme family)/thioredoxin reductase
VIGTASGTGSGKASSAESSRYPQLFAPINVGTRTLRNRIAHVSMTTRMSVDRRVTDTLLNYYASRARGGAALIVTEPVSGARFQNAPHKVRIWDDASEAGLARWAECVEREDCRLLAQLQDPGRGRHERGRNPDAFGASALADDLSWTVPHTLSLEAVERMIADWAESSRRLQRCGFSGVELSAAHGHLFHQFLSPWMNVREDRYGGDLEGRCRVLADLTAAIRSACGRGFIIGLKLPGDDGMDGSIGPDQAGSIARHLLSSGGGDYLCFAQGSHSYSLDRHIPDLHGPRAPYVELTRRLKRELAGIPIMAVGLITDPAEADAILASGAADLIGLGRPLVTDPAWGLKSAQGREAAIRYCVSCNSCWAAITEHRALACDNNPRVGAIDEVDWWPRRTGDRKRIVVVGAGIAGMEAAWIAAARGHDVWVFGASPDVGGKTRLLSRLPGGEALSSIYDYQALAAKKSGARLELGVRASIDDVRALQPDSVVLAVGAEMTWPRGMPGSWREEGCVLDLRACMLQMLEFSERQSGTAVIYDRDATEGTYAAAEWLRRLFERVVLLTPRDRIAEDVPLVSRLAILRRFAFQGIESITLAEVDETSRLEDGVVGYKNIFTGKAGKIADVALLTYATPRAPDLRAFDGLEGLDGETEIHVIGDAYAPGTTMAATAHGHRVGNAL